MAPHNDIETFHNALRSSRRILALCGAGLSAASGLPTFRGSGGLWRNYEATKLATPTAFKTDPGLVWLFYGYRRHCALKVEPNDGHRALAALSRRMKKNFLCVSQNVDNLTQRAGHLPDNLVTLHGSLFDVKCANNACSWVERGNFDDPYCEALAPASVDAPKGEPNPLLDPYHRIKHIHEDELPRCPKCKTGLRRPGVVWFGEKYDQDIIGQINDFKYEKPYVSIAILSPPPSVALRISLESHRKLHIANISFLDVIQDMLIVVGTSATLSVPESFIRDARRKGVPVVNIDLRAEDPDEMAEMRPGDYAFAWDAAKALPALLEPVIGKMKQDGSYPEP